MAIIDLVRWAPQGNQTIYAYRFPETNLSTYTQLIVQESQEAILFSKGQIVGKFGPGKHTLNTENLPILRSLYGLPFGGKNPFTAEVWFVNKLQPYNIDWSIDRMDIHDADYNTGIPLVANGRYGLKITDAERFLIKIVGTKNSFDQNDLTDQFFGEFSTKTKSTILQFMINGRRVLDAISRQSAQSIGGYTWQQEKAFDVAKDAVDGLSNSNSGIMGAIVASNMMGGLGGAGGVMQPQYNQPTFGGTNQNQQGNNVQPVNQVKEVYCSNCSKKFSSTHRFCPHCGDPYDACPKCGTDNDKNAKRCVSCGTPLQTEMSLCTNCNTPLAPGSSFCGNCGQQQAENKCTRCGTALNPTIKFCPKCGQKR